MLRFHKQGIVVKQHAKDVLFMSLLLSASMWRGLRVSWVITKPNSLSFLRSFSILQPLTGAVPYGNSNVFTQEEHTHTASTTRKSYSSQGKFYLLIHRYILVQVECFIVGKVCSFQDKPPPLPILSSKNSAFTSSFLAQETFHWSIHLLLTLCFGFAGW